MALRNSDTFIPFHKRYLNICVYNINPIVCFNMSQVQLPQKEQRNHVTQNIVHFYVGSDIKFYVESAKGHIGDIEKLPV